MRRGRVWFVFRVVGRDAGEQLSRSGSASERSEHHYHRGNLNACFDEAFARSVSRMRRRAVWHLHAGNDSRGGAFAEEETGARAGGHSRGASRQPLPLDGFSANFPSGYNRTPANTAKIPPGPSQSKLGPPLN